LISLNPARLFILASLFVLTFAGLAPAQQLVPLRFPRPSQKASLLERVGSTKVTIIYSRPSVGGRKIFEDAPASMAARAVGEATLDNQNERRQGEPIVPFGHVWRAGANEATTFQVTNDVLINGQPLKAGTYSLQAIPGKDEWTIIFNNDPGQWGAFLYDARKDALRVKAKPQWESESQEWLIYRFDPITLNSAKLELSWEKVRVPFVIQDVSQGPPAGRHAAVQQTVGVTSLIIDYSRSAAGLSEFMEFRSEDDVLINGQNLTAGRYDLKVTPGNDNWTLAFIGDNNKNLQIRVTPVIVPDDRGSLEFAFPAVGPNSTQVLLRSGKYSLLYNVSVPNVEKLALARAEAVIAANPTNELYPLQLASFYAGLRKWDEALKAIDQSIGTKKTFGNLSAKAIYLKSAGRSAEANATAALAVLEGKAQNVNTLSFEKRFADTKFSPPIQLPTEDTTAKTTAVNPAKTTVENSAPKATENLPAATEVNRPDTRILTRETKATTTATTAGQFYALVIGNDRYQYVPGLKMAEADAKAVATLLESKFAFATQLLLNAKRQDVMSALSTYRRTLDPNDNLLIYFAGHGYYDREIDRAYWLPVDARAEDNANWISADDITNSVKGVPAKHVLIISDSCYSGAISRDLVMGGSEPIGRSRFLEKMIAGKSRTLMASGGNEPVSDDGGSGHSIFARAFLIGLTGLDKDVFTAGELFRDFIQERVAGSARQTPEYSPLRNSGHESGDFVFIRK
jgi:hypothetical protein